MRLIPLVSLVSFFLVACEQAPSSAGSAPDAAALAAPSAAPTASAVAPSVASSAPAAAPTKVAAQHVLVAYKGAKGAPADVKRSKADAKARAEEVRTKALAGTDFGALAVEYSDDPASKARQGSVGVFTRDKMVKEFSDAAFALPVDGVSALVESPFGFHVIKRNQ